jgi:hypothetical protein
MLTGEKYMAAWFAAFFAPYTAPIVEFRRIQINYVMRESQ